MYKGRREDGKYDGRQDSREYIVARSNSGKSGREAEAEARQNMGHRDVQRSKDTGSARREGD